MVTEGAGQQSQHQSRDQSQHQSRHQSQHQPEIGTARRRRRNGALLVVPTVAAMVAALVAATTGGASGAVQARGLVPSDGGAVRLAPPIESEAPLFEVTKEGMTQKEADALAERAGIPAALMGNGAFSYVDPAKYGKLPTRRGDVGRDEAGRRTVEQKLNLKQLRAIETLPDNDALKKAGALLTLPEGFEAEPRISHTHLELMDRKGELVDEFDLDTAVSFDLMLGEHRLVGPGNRNRIAFAGDGSVISLNQNLREVQQKGFVGIVGPDTAKAECARMYGPNVDMLAPELVYYSPPLGEGSVGLLVPHYSCRPAADVRSDPSVVGKLVPAAPELMPEVSLDGVREGSSVEADLSITGGEKPFRIVWSSATTRLKGGGESIAYDVAGRGRAQLAEMLTATVTDANGLISSASISLPAAGGQASSAGFGGAGGILASVGSVNTVDEWTCAQQSPQGFRNVMSSKGHTVKFDWRGTNAWETDFKKASASGHDDDYVDSVDVQWYTGHGSPGSFTFKNTTHTDGNLTPSDARWGDNFNLEWMQLESCQVLRDTNGQNDYFQRWAPAFDGLHLLNGFHTNATCISGGTGGRFASYLFPDWWRPALTVVQAWQAMANDLEPGGTVWRSISPAKAGWVTNMGDHMWGQGSVGPDIPLSQQIGWVAISGTV